MLPATALRRVSTLNLDMLQRSNCPSIEPFPPSPSDCELCSLAEGTPSVWSHQTGRIGMALAGTIMCFHAGRGILYSRQGRHREASPELNGASIVQLEPSHRRFVAGSSQSLQVLQAVQVDVQRTEYSLLACSR